MRSYFRFRAFRGDRTEALIAAIPSVAQWPQSGLPRHLTADELARFLDAFDQRTVSGKRGYAMARCLVDLGLRASEVARIELDDLNWREGTLRIRTTKSRRVDVLPLPAPTGQAIVQYLRHTRAQRVGHALFVRHRAPIDAPVSTAIVRNTVRLAFARCGLAARYGGTHVLRHTAATSERAKPMAWACRLRVLRPFARYRLQFDPATEVPPLHLLGPAHPRLAPHVYTAQEIVSLLEAANALSPKDGLRPLTYQTLFGLIAATGLRVSEARSLTRADVEFERAVLTVRNSKFRKSRLVPLHPTTIRALQRYAEIRDRKVPLVHTAAFFVSDRGKALDKRTVQYTFAKLRQKLGWRARGGHPAPRVHDLRHTFICQALLRTCRKRPALGHDLAALFHLRRSRQSHLHLLVRHRHSRTYGARRPALRAFCPWRFPMNTPDINAAFARLLQQFFLERLLQQRNASAQTVASYRDTFRLLLQFAERQLHKPPARLELTDLDASFVLAFLNHLERERKNSIRSRNARLAAIRSFLHYAALKAPTALPSIQSVLAIPLKRFERPMIGFLSQAEIAAVLNAPDGASWCGQRDRAMLATLYNTGARVSELIGMRVGDVVLERSASVRIHGKGRVPCAPPTSSCADSSRPIDCYSS